MKIKTTEMHTIQVECGLIQVKCGLIIANRYGDGVVQITIKQPGKGWKKPRTRRRPTVVLTPREAATLMKDMEAVVTELHTLQDKLSAAAASGGLQ